MSVQMRAQIAEVAGVDVSEIVLIRNATEALQNLIVNYNKLKPGDTVLYADFDYDSAQENIEYLRETRSINRAHHPTCNQYSGLPDLAPYSVDGTYYYLRSSFRF